MQIMKQMTAFGLLLFTAMFVVSSCGIDPTDTTSDDASSQPESIDPATEFTVTFDLNYPGAEGTPPPQTIVYNNLVSEPETPIREDYTFTHWSSDLYGSNVWNFATDAVISNMTLHAAWEYTYVEPPIEKKTYYLNAPAFWLVDSYTAGLFAWDIDGVNKVMWPGEKMTYVEGEIFSLEVPVNYTSIIFVRLTPEGAWPEEGARSQSGDLDLESLIDSNYNYYTLDEAIRFGGQESPCRGRWSVYPNDPEPYPPVDTITLYVDVPTYWHTEGRVAGVYLWNSSGNNAWPGELMTLVGGEIYSFEVPDDYINIIFNALTPIGVEPATNKVQTVDEIIPIDGKNLFTIDDAVVHMPSKCTGVWSTYTP